MTTEQYPNLHTVRELIEALSKLPQDSLVGALGPSSMTCYPIYIQVEGGVVELIGDEQVRQVRV